MMHDSFILRRLKVAGQKHKKKTANKFYKLCECVQFTRYCFFIIPLFESPDKGNKTVGTFLVRNMITFTIHIHIQHLNSIQIL